MTRNTSFRVEEKVTPCGITFAAALAVATVLVQSCCALSLVEPLCSDRYRCASSRRFERTRTVLRAVSDSASRTTRLDQSPNRLSSDVDAAVSWKDRRRLLTSIPPFLATATAIAPDPSLLPYSYDASSVASAFEGGVGGLGKTKPETGVVYWSDDVATLPTTTGQTTGAVSAELNVAGQPVLVRFTTPWPLLASTSGLEARDLQNTPYESAFVQVVTKVAKPPTTVSAMSDLLLGTVFSQQGKFGAYGDPFDVKVKQLIVGQRAGITDDVRGSDQRSPPVVTCTVTFTTLTPGLRESERQMLVSAVRVGDSQNWILCLVGTTRQRFPTQQELMQSVVESFDAIPAPRSAARR